MESGKGQGPGDDSQQGGRPWILQKKAGYHVSVLVNEPGDQAGEQEGETCACEEKIVGSLLIMDRGFAGRKTGDGRGHSRHGEGQAESLDRKNKLIDSKLLCTNCVREEYFIEEAHQPAQKPCGGEDESPPENLLFRSHKILPFLFSIFQKSP